MNINTNMTKESSMITFGVFWSYLLFYTMFSKAEQTLVPKQLIEIITFQKGLNKFLVEMNKAVALSGLTTLCLTITPCSMLEDQRIPLLEASLWQLVVHFVYSVYQYYGTSKIPPITQWLMISSEPAPKG